MADTDELISILRKQAGGSKPALVIPHALAQIGIRLAKTPEGVHNQVQHLIREIRQARGLGRVNLSLEKALVFERIETNGAKTLEDAQWIVDLYAKHRVFDAIWQRPEK